jgi:elongation factor G
MPTAPSALPTSKIRNVALVGHSGAGKTSVVEALLKRAGAVARAGRVDDGTSTCDTEPEEQRRHMSLSLAVAPFEWVIGEGDRHKVNLLDTPGWSDFAAEVEAALRVADLAVFVVSAVDGVEAGTERAWRRCEELNLPRLVFLNKLDKERADYEGVLAQLRDTFGQGIAPLELPLGLESSFTGVADLLSDAAFVYSPDGTHRVEEVPDSLSELEHQVHDNLVEGIVVADDELLERYLSGDAIEVHELEKALAHGVVAGTVFPVVLGSAATGVGIDRLADFLCEIGPSPADRPPVPVIAGPTEAEVAPDAGGQPLAFVFKTVADQFIGQVSLFKVLSGTIRNDDVLVNPGTGTQERLHGLFHLRGKEQLPAAAVVAGDIAAVAKLAATRTGDTLAPKGTPVRVERLAVPPAVYAVAIKARTQADDDKLSSSIQRLQAEDLALRLHRDDETHQTVLQGTGDTHLAVALERLTRKFGVNVDVEELRVPYRETVVGRAEAEGKHKKQSGGHGQFGVAWLRVEPLARGAGFEFVDSIVGGAIPRQFIPAVQKGVEETMAAGGLHGFPVVDVRVECFDGKYHSVDSSEMSFKLAAAAGFKDCLAKAGVVVLEPVSLLRIVVPASYQGDVMGDINGRRGRVQGTEPIGRGEQEIAAVVPTAEVLRYAIELRSMTGGRGRFTAAHDHYDVLPAHLVERAAASLKASKS